MTREQLRKVITEELEEVKRLFEEKNESYGQEEDAFYNFRSTAQRLFDMEGHGAMFDVLLVYMDKHLVALANQGITEKEFELRMRDIIVYSLIAIAMQRDMDGQKTNN